MRIQYKLFINTLVSLVLISFLYVSVFTTTNIISDQEKEHVLASDIQTAVFELNLLLNEYLLHREDRVLEQWNTRHHSGLLLLNKIGTDNRNQDFVRDIRAEYLLLDDLFQKEVENYHYELTLTEEQASAETLGLVTALQERIISQLLITSQSVSSAAQSLEELTYEQTQAAIEQNRILTLLLVLSFFVLTTIISVIVSRSIVKPLLNLEKAVTKFGKGKLDTKIDIQSKDEIGHLASSFNDMATKLEELNKLKDDFLNTATHELKTPLIPIKSQAQLLLGGDYGKLNKKQKNAIEMIARNGDHLNDLVSDVLSITKIRSRKIRLILEEADLGQIISDAVNDMQSIARNKQIDITLSHAENLPLLVIDTKRISEVMHNLLDNSVKFTPEGGRVDVDVSRTQNNVRVTVTDTGIGMDKKTLKKLFTPFFQADSEITRRYGGTGLGLSIAKGFVVSHGGKISAKSAGLGKGSAFTFTLPLKKNLHKPTK